jgi:hypothetical protein
MLSTLFDKVTGLFDKQFVLTLLLPVFAFAAGTGALAATMIGWHRSVIWWSALDGARQVGLAVAAAAAIIILAILLGLQLVAMTRLLEGYWSRPVDATMGRLGRWRERKRRGNLLRDNSEVGYQRFYVAFAADLDQVLPTRLGNALRAAESYAGDDQRWGIDAVYWWPRLYLVLTDSTRAQVDETRAGLDQMVVMTLLTSAFAVVALALTCAGLNLTVGLSCAVGGLVLARGWYLTAVTTATVYGDLVRSCYDLFRGDLLAKLGWAMPLTLPEERRLWRALGQQFYRRGVDQDAEHLINGPRDKPAVPLPAPGAAQQDGRRRVFGWLARDLQSGGRLTATGEARARP